MYFDNHKLYVTLPASYVWDDDNECWIVNDENGWRVVDALNSKHLINVSVRRSMIGLLPDNLPPVEIEYYKVKGNVNESPDDKAVFYDKDGSIVFEYLMWVEDDEDNKFSKFVVACRDDNSDHYTVYYGNVRWGSYVPEIEKPNFVEVKEEIDYKLDIVDGKPVLVGVAKMPVTGVFNYVNIALKPGEVDDEVTVPASEVEIDGVCPPFWPNDDDDGVTVKVFVGAKTALLDTPLRPDLRR